MSVCMRRRIRKPGLERDSQTVSELAVAAIASYWPFEQVVLVRQSVSSAPIAAAKTYCEEVHGVADRQPSPSKTSVPGLQSRHTRSAIGVGPETVSALGAQDDVVGQQMRSDVVVAAATWNSHGELQLENGAHCRFEVGVFSWVMYSRSDTHSRTPAHLWWQWWWQWVVVVAVGGSGWQWVVVG